MTRVRLEKKGQHYFVECKGHAEGSQEACSAVSCLVYTLAGWLTNANTLVLERDLNGDAHAKIHYYGSGAAETAFDMICVGFLQLEKAYGAYVSVDCKIN